MASLLAGPWQRSGGRPHGYLACTPHCSAAHRPGSASAIFFHCRPNAFSFATRIASSAAVHGVCLSAAAGGAGGWGRRLACVYTRCRWWREGVAQTTSRYRRARPFTLSCRRYGRREGASARHYMHATGSCTHDRAGWPSARGSGWQSGRGCELQGWHVCVCVCVCAQQGQRVPQGAAGRKQRRG